VIRGRPVLLHAKDGHGIWVSGKAMELSLPLPDAIDGGIIIRDSAGIATGTRSPCSCQNRTQSLLPTGVFLDNAQDLIQKPPLTDENLLKLFNRTIRDALSLGLTSIHDAGLDPMSLAFFKRSIHLHKPHKQS
jgi:predicted amidohydrolase YtcJ